MKLKAKSQISNNNKNVVYVINNNLPKKRKRNKPKPTMNNSTKGNPTEPTSQQQNQTQSSSITLPDNRFLNSSNLGTEIQRANLKLIDNPQLRMNEPNIPLLENSYDQRLLQIQDALQQQIENTRFGMNYLYSRFDNNQPVIEEIPNEEDNFGNFAETKGSDFFVNEGDNNPDFEEPQQPTIDEINDTPQQPPKTPPMITANEFTESPSPPNPEIVRMPTKKYKIRRDGFQSPMGYNKSQQSEPVPGPFQSDEIDMTEPKHIPIPNIPQVLFKQSPIKEQPQPEQAMGKMESKKLELRQEYISLNGRNTHILNSPLKHLTVTQIREFITTQRKINDKLNQYQANGGNDPDILNSQSLNVVSDAVKALIKQNNSRKSKR